jgi:diguanylate cyclase (GGDEF)-like protein
MEGFDIRTLALTNLLLGVFLGMGSLVFARIHASFKGFNALGYSYFLFSLGFILIGLRQYIPDFLSIVIANLSIVTAFSLLIIGILNFLKYDETVFKNLSVAVLLLMAIGFIYFTYVKVNLHARVFIISAILASYSIFAAFKVLTNKDPVTLTFTRFLGLSFVFAAFIFLLRVMLSFNDPELVNFMNGGVIHALSLISLQLVTITSCFSLTISASQKLATELSTQATIDPLTNIYNRRAFEESSNKEILRAQRELTPISLILADIDLFKQINDNYGHQVGDKVLQEFSLRLKNSVRQYDILARYGGEEFVLLLPDTNAAVALVVAEKLRETIAQSVFVPQDKMTLNITASFGIAANQYLDMDWKKLVSLADEALYQAKDSGRNCIKLHSAHVIHIPKMKKPSSKFSK